MPIKDDPEIRKLTTERNRYRQHAVMLARENAELKRRLTETQKSLDELILKLQGVAGEQKQD